MTLSAFQSLNQQPALVIEILNVQKTGGKIVVAVYKEKSGWLKSPFRTMTLSADENAKTATLSVPPGAYAISIYQDVNENGKLDQNFLGIPKEPIGFGNNYRPLGKPDFEAASIEHTAASKPAAIRLFTVF
jgi:uncharacterized protein (DUF2141 family)